MKKDKKKKQLPLGIYMTNLMYQCTFFESDINKNKIWDAWLYNDFSSPQLGLSCDFENPLEILYLILCSCFFFLIICKFFIMLCCQEILVSIYLSTCFLSINTSFVFLYFWKWFTVGITDLSLTKKLWAKTELYELR